MNYFKKPVDLTTKEGKQEFRSTVGTDVPKRVVDSFEKAGANIQLYICDYSAAVAGHLMGTRPGEEGMDDETAGTDRQIGGDAEGATKEEHRVSGDKVIGKIKELIHQGNVRRIIIKNDEGRSLIEIPLSVGVVGAVLV